MQNDLVQSKIFVEQISAKQAGGEASTNEVTQLQAKAESVKAAWLLLEERFALRENVLKQVGGVALERHRDMVGDYRQALMEFLSIIEGIPSGGPVPQATLNGLSTLLDSILAGQDLPILGSLPYRHQSFPSAEPLSSPAIVPAYQTDNSAAAQEDLTSTPEAPISKEIAELAQSLGWDPVSIYEYVKNNVETEWYWGCMKGAEETLRQKSGNDCDQATLLVALMRAAGFPSRYVRGVIELTDEEKLKNLTGTSDAASSADLLAKGGIPSKKLIAGGVFAGLQLEHIWVESQIPYLNYRGAVVDGRGKVWLGLDTSIKASGYTYNAALDVVPRLALADFRDHYLEGIRAETPLELLRDWVDTELSANYPGKTYANVLLTRTLNSEAMNILPASMQYKTVVITGEYAKLPDSLKHRVRITAADGAQHELFAISLDAGVLSNRQVVISYEPETVEDQRIIDLYAGLNNTPAYLVHLRPVLKVDGERLIVGQDGLAMGKSYDLSVEFIAPNGSERITNKQICGNVTALGIVAQRAIQPAAMEAEEKDAERLLYEEAINYIERWNHSEDELAALLHVSPARPLPTYLAVGGVIDVTYLLNVPHGFKLKGVFVDAGLRMIGVAPSTREKDFMKISALQGSVLEGRLFEEDFLVEAMSTAKLIGMAGLSQTITIDKNNVATVLPNLTLSANVKADISSAVNQNYIVRVPASETTHMQWTGVGYIKEDQATGEAGYMLSGMIAGGMTAWSMDYWPDYYADRISNPYAERPAMDRAGTIQKVVATDLQSGKVGEKLGQALQVVVKDKKGQPVKDAMVTFMVKAGGGTLIGGGAAGTSITVPTNYAGIASAELTLGRYTKDNPTYWWEDGYTYSQQIGENGACKEFCVNGFSFKS